MSFTNIYQISLQLLIVIVWVSKYKKLEKDIVKLERKGLVYSLALNAWSIVFLAQTVLGPILTFGRPQVYVVVLGYIFYTIGATLAIIGRLNLGTSWGLPMQHNVKSQQELVRKGIYRYTRNPIYLSEMMMLVGFELILHSWLLLLVVPFYFWNKRKAIKEEYILKNVFKEPYVHYMSKVPRFL